MTKIIAITGGIGSGKSTFSAHLISIGYKVHDSDGVVFDLYKKPNKEFKSFIKNLGVQNVFKKNKVDKNVITEKIFNNHVLKKKIERYIHKEVRKKREIFIKKNSNKKNKVIFLDIPLLFENNLSLNFDFIIGIIATKAIRLKRVLKQKKFSEKIFNKIIKNQTTDKDRKKYSDVIIHNNKTKKEFIKKGQKIIMRYLK